MICYEIHFICHGAIEENKKGQYIGTKDVPLSKNGIDLLKKYDTEFIYPGTPFLYSSPLLRCIQTCNILYPNIKPIVLDGLRECSFGDWEGKTASELKGDMNFAAWLSNSNEVTPPGGENNKSFTLRICRTFEKIVSDLIKSGETRAVVVTHGGIIMTLLSIYGIPQASPFEWQMDNGFGFAVRIDPFLWSRDKVVEVFDKTPKIKDEFYE